MGLYFARGEFLVIYDAEDRPEPGQLREAVAAFRAGDERLVCVQARLNYFNAAENLLTRMFTLEYSYWFDYMLPGLDALRPAHPARRDLQPLPHRRSCGSSAAGTRFNVTEDADLGLRANARGLHGGHHPLHDLRGGLLALLALDPPAHAGGSRATCRPPWSHSRHPLQTVRRTGWRGLVGLRPPDLRHAVHLPGRLPAVDRLPGWLGGAVTGLYDLPQMLPGPLATVALASLVLGNGADDRGQRPGRRAAGASTRCCRSPCSARSTGSCTRSRPGGRSTSWCATPSTGRRPRTASPPSSPRWP